MAFVLARSARYSMPCRVFSRCVTPLYVHLAKHFPKCASHDMTKLSICESHLQSCKQTFCCAGNSIPVHRSVFPSGPSRARRPHCAGTNTRHTGRSNVSEHQRECAELSVRRCRYRLVFLFFFCIILYLQKYILLAWVTLKQYR